MDKEEFIKLVTRVLSKEADLTEEEELNKLLENDPELAKRFRLLAQFWKEDRKEDKDDDTRREKALNLVWNKIKNSKKEN